MGGTIPIMATTGLFPSAPSPGVFALTIFMTTMDESPTTLFLDPSSREWMVRGDRGKFVTYNSLCGLLELERKHGLRFQRY